MKKIPYSFLPIPEALMLDQSLSEGAKIVFGLIAKTNLEQVKWSAKYLAGRMNCSDREVRRRVKELTDRNLILVSRIQNQWNIYSINIELVVAGGTDEAVSTDRISQESTDRDVPPLVSPLKKVVRTRAGNDDEMGTKDKKKGETSSPGGKSSIEARNAKLRIISHFKAKFEEEHGVPPIVANGQAFGFLGYKLKDHTEQEIREIIDFAFEHAKTNKFSKLNTIGACFRPFIVNEWRIKEENLKKLYA